MFVGVAVLVDGVAVRRAGAATPPSDEFDVLPWPGLLTGAGAGVVVVLSIAVLAAGAGAGVLGARRDGYGLVAFIGLEVVLSICWYSTRPGAVGSAVVGFAGLVGVMTYVVLQRVPTNRSPGVHRAAAGVRPAGSGDRARVLPRIVMSRRQALVSGGLLAAAAGAAGLVLRGSDLPATAPRDAQRGVVPPPDSGQPLLKGPVFDIRDFGATGDGRTDDGDAVRQALARANGEGGTVYFPAGEYYYRATGTLKPSGGVTLAGMPGRSTIKYDSAVTGYSEFCSVEADGVTLDGLVIERAGAFSAVLVATGAVQDFLLSRTRLVGNHGSFSGTFCHGLKLGENGTAGRIRLIDAQMTTVDYGLLRTNASTAVVTDISVERCTFTKNANTDLEFNSPIGSIRQVRVENCSFSDNDSAGFGVGLANVQDAQVRSNSFTGYGLEAVHVEDYSENVAVSSNTFIDCGLRQHSHIQIIGRSHDVRVTGNTFQAHRNTNQIYVVSALAGGDATTPGGRPPGPPGVVVVADNRFECAPSVTPVYFQQVDGGSITSNTISGPALTGPGDAFRLLDDPGTSVTGNQINGTTY